MRAQESVLVVSEDVRCSSGPPGGEDPPFTTGPAHRRTDARAHASSECRGSRIEVLKAHHLSCCSTRQTRVLRAAHPNARVSVTEGSWFWLITVRLFSHCIWMHTFV